MKRTAEELKRLRELWQATGHNVGERALVAERIVERGIAFISMQLAHELGLSRASVHDEQPAIQADLISRYRAQAIIWLLNELEGKDE